MRIEVDFSELEIETTVTVLLHKFQIGKIELPMEVALCLPGMEATGWRAAARRVLKDGLIQRHREVLEVL